MTLDISEHVPSSPQRDGEVMRILRHYFKQMVKLEQIPAGKSLQIIPEYFLGWVRNKLGLILSDEPPEEHPERFEYDQMMQKYAEERDELCERYKVGEGAWRYCMQLVYSTAGAMQIFPVWSSVLLHDRPVPQFPVKSLHVCMLVEWEDGMLMPYSCFIPAELAMSAPGGTPLDNGLTDPVVANLLHKYMRDWINDVVTQGVDVLHDTNAKRYGGEYPYNVLMGMMLYIIKANQAVRDGKTIDPAAFAEEHGMSVETVNRLGKVVPSLDPKILDYMEGYMRLCQAMIRPPMPKAFRDEIEKRRRLKREAAIVKPQQVSGGWDG